MLEIYALRSRVHTAVVRRTLPRAPTAPRRAWLSRSPHDVPGERPSSTPRTALTAAPRSVLRPPAAQLARAHPETASRAAAPHHVPVAVSSPAPRTVPDPSRYPVHAADSQHTRSSARPVPPSSDLKPPCRAATSTATVTRLESRRTSRRDGAYKYYANYILSPPAERNVFLDFYDRFAVLSPDIPGSCDALPKYSHRWALRGQEYGGGANLLALPHRPPSSLSPIS